MPRTLFVHIGPRKTATTAIQHLLSRHDNSIVIYPKVGLWGPGSHHGLVFKFFGEQRDGRVVKGNLDEMLHAISREVRDTTQDIVISSEALESRDVGSFVHGLLNQINDSMIKVEVIFTCREHFSRAASWYNHRLRARKSAEKRTPDRFLQEDAQGVCYAPIVERLKSTGFKITAMNYHPSEDWVERFFTHIGFPKERIPKIENKLVSLSPKALIVNLAINQFVRQGDAKREYLKPFKKMSDSQSPSRFIFGAQAAESAERHFAVDRQLLLEEFDIRLVPPDIGSRENALSINEKEFEEIGAVAKNLGADGVKIVEFSRQYLRA